MLYLIYILVGWGITDFLVNGSILDKLRVYFLIKFPLLAKLLSCIRCSGFWVGVLMGCTYLLVSGLDIWGSYLESSFLTVIGSGFLISGSSVIINALMVYFLTKNFKNNREPLDE